LDNRELGAGNTYLLHDLVGVHTLDNVSQAMTNSPNCMHDSELADDGF